MHAARIPLPPLLTVVDPVPLVARDEAWAALDRAWHASNGGAARQVALVPGEAGAGKTRLLTEFARDLHDRGATVLYGTCAEAQTVPYQPFAEALDHVVASVDLTTAQLRLGDDASELARLLPGRASKLGAPAPAGHGDPDAERARLFGAVIGAIAELARANPVALLLDDVHWARRPTVDLLDQLVHVPSLTDVLVVVAYRSASADAGDALRSVLPDLRRLPGVSRIPLGGFDRAGVGEFVAAVAGHDVDAALGPAVDVLARQTDGNAFLLVELWQHLVDSGQVARDGGRWVVRGALTDVSSPEGVREVVAARVGRLDPDTRRVLEIAAVAGTTFDPRDIAAAAGMPVDEVLSTLDVVAGSRLVGEDGAGRARFVHELIRRSIYDGLGSADRRRHHLALARAVADGAASGRRAEVARHLAAAVPLADARDAVAAAVDAAGEAAAAVAYDDAARFLETALAITPDDPVELLLRLADVRMRAGDVARAKEHCLGAHERARRAGDAASRTAAALAYSDAVWRDARDAATAASLLRDVFPFATDDVTRVRLQASLTRALALAGDGDAAQLLGEDALNSARGIDDRYARRLAYDAVSYVPWSPARIEGQLAAMREAAALAVAEGDVEWENHAVSKTLYGQILAGQLEEARATAARHHALAMRVGEPLFRALDCQARALLAIGEGRFDVAEALAEEAEELGRTLSGARAGGYGVQLFSIRREQGRLEEARPVVEAVARLGKSGATWRPALAVMYAELGLPDEAAAEIDALHADRLAAVPRDALWHGSLSYLADACVLVGHEAGAAAVYEALIPWRGFVVQIGHLLAANGAVDRFLGKLAALLGHEREADIHFEAAVRLESAARMPVWLAHTHLDAGLALLRRTRPEDVARGEELVRAALDDAERLGMRGVAAAARDALAGAAPPSARPPAGLTEREVAVLELMADGCSNREIGSRLHISQHTAANHVRSILMKTQSANRTEAAAWALRRGVAGVSQRRR